MNSLLSFHERAAQTDNVSSAILSVHFRHLLRPLEQSYSLINTHACLVYEWQYDYELGSYRELYDVALEIML